MKPRAAAMRYVTQFRCVGADCVATCCTSWSVYVDQPHYVQLRRKLTPAEPTAADPRFRLFPKHKRTANLHALIVMRQDESCPFLSAEQLCEVHRDHGAEVLPDVCASYPRVTHLVADRLEQGAFLSCPEIARLALLDRGATDVLDVEDPFGGGRKILSSRKVGETGTAVAAWRELLLDMLGQDARSTHGRLFALGAMALRVLPSFTAKKFVPRELHSHLEALGHPGVMDKLESVAAQHARPNGFALETVVRALSMRPASGVRTSYNTLMASILPTMERLSDGAVTRVDGNFAIDTDALVPAYERRSALLTQRFGPLLQTAHLNFARHALWSDGPTVALGGQATFALSVLVRVAMHQMLFAFHPRVDEALTSGDAASLREVIPDVCFCLARELEHNAAMMKVYQRAVLERVVSLPEAAAIAGLC